MVPRVVLDCDTGIDDALALVYLAALDHAGEIDLVGITTTSGNVEAQQCAHNSAYILDLCGMGSSVPIAIGQEQPLVVPLITTPETHGSKGLGYVDTPHMGTFSYDWQKIWDESDADHLIVTGPATNIASYKAAYAHKAQITLMGGSYLYPGNTTPTAEWNTWVDPHAAKKLFASAQTPITVCSLEITEQFLFNPTYWASCEKILLKKNKTELAQVLSDALRFYYEFHESVGVGYCAQIHDLLSVMIALSTIPYSARLVSVDVEADSPLMRGTTVADYSNIWKKQPNANLITRVDVDAAYREFARALYYF